MFGQNRVIVMTTGRASLSGRCQEAVAQADMRHQTNGAALRLALTPLCSSVIGWDWIVIDLDRSVIGPGSTVTHKVSQRESPLKRLHELCETCHSEPMFHSTAVKYFRSFLIPALHLDRRLRTEGLVKIQSTRKWKQPKRTSSRWTIEQFRYWFDVLRRHTHIHTHTRMCGCKEMPCM